MDITDNVLKLSEALAEFKEATGIPLTEGTVRQWIVEKKCTGQKAGGNWFTTSKCIAFAAKQNKSVMDTDSGAAGGYLVKPQMVAPQVANIAPFSGFAAYGQTATTKDGTNQIDIPLFAPPATADPASGFGTFTFQSLPDNDTSDPLTVSVLARRSLRSQLIRAHLKVSNTFLQDSTTLGSIIENQAYANFSAFMDSLFLTGNGVNQPLGIVLDAAALQVNRATSFKITSIDVAAMAAALYDNGDMSKAFWYCSPSARAQIAQLPANEVSARSPNPVQMTLLGRPVYINPYMAQLGSLGDLVLVNGIFWLNFIRQAPEVVPSAHVFFTSYQTIYRIDGRMNGCLMAAAPFKVGNSTTLAPPSS